MGNVKTKILIRMTAGKRRNQDYKCPEDESLRESWNCCDPGEAAYIFPELVMGLCVKMLQNWAFKGSIQKN
jgi:hypothetical protein